MPNNEEQTKECTKCGQEKPLSGFYKNKMRRFGVRSQCKVCVLAQMKQYRQENRDKVLEQKKQYRQKNKDKIVEREKQHYQENKDKILEQKKQYYQKNKDKISERVKQYRQENKDKISAQNKQYRQNLPSMIYEIHNTITKQIYVGQTSYGRQRWNGHKHKLRKGIHGNPQLQKDWDKWGKDAFRFNIVEELPCDFNTEQLLEKEAALMLEHISNGAKLYNEDIPE